MLKIKLIRYGKKGQPHYRFVIQEAKTKRDGKYTAAIGHYAPTQKPKVLEIDMEAYQSWLEKGAQPTETVASLAKRYQKDNPFPKKKKKPSKKQLAKKQAQEESKEEAKEESSKKSEKAEAKEEKTAKTEEKVEKKAEAKEKKEETKKEKDEVKKPKDEVKKEAETKKEEK